MNQLHHHEQFRVGAKQFVDAGNPRVAQPRQDRRFGAEALEDFGIGNGGIQDLQRDFAAERVVDRLVDDARGAAAEFSDDAVFADDGAGHAVGRHGP